MRLARNWWLFLLRGIMALIFGVVAILFPQTAFLSLVLIFGAFALVNDFPAVNFIGMSACYSPNGTSFDLPFDTETGEIRRDVLERWCEHDPVRLLERYVESLKSLRLLFIDAGLRDEFALDLGARILSKRLKEHDIPHIHEEFDDGHFNISYRQDRSLELISKHLP